MVSHGGIRAGLTAAHDVRPVRGLSKFENPYTAGKTRTWILRDPYGTPLAEITTRRDTRKLADLLNRVMDGQCSPSR